VVKKLPALEADLRGWFARNGIESATLDGEMMPDTGVYHVFDFIEGRSETGAAITRMSDTLLMRQDFLNHALLHNFGTVHKATTADTHADKVAMWESINLANVEGAISKRLDSLYVPGSRTKEWVKHKLVKTADVVVTAVARTFDHKGMVTHGTATLAVNIDPNTDPEPFENSKGKRAEALEMPDAGTPDSLIVGPKGFEYRPRDMMPVGNASLIGKELTIEAGSVVEVAYLNFQTAMIQPRIVKQRFDKAAGECDLDQFPEYTRAVVEL